MWCRRTFAGALCTLFPASDRACVAAYPSLWSIRFGLPSLSLAAPPLQLFPRRRRRSPRRARTPCKLRAVRASGRTPSFSKHVARATASHTLFVSGRLAWWHNSRSGCERSRVHFPGHSCLNDGAAAWASDEVGVGVGKERALRLGDERGAEELIGDAW